MLHASGSISETKKDCMPKLDISVSHKLPQQEAILRIRGLLSDLKEEFSGQISGLRETWNHDTCTFSFSTMGFHVSGTLTVTKKNIRLTGRLPLAAMPFRGMIEKAIKERATQLL